jgi:hypothetical protein
VSVIGILVVEMVTASEKEIVTQAGMTDREIEKGIAAVVSQIEQLLAVLHPKKLAAIRGVTNDQNAILVGNLTLKLKLQLVLMASRVNSPIISKAFWVHLQPLPRNII